MKASAANAQCKSCVFWPPKQSEVDIAQAYQTITLDILHEVGQIVICREEPWLENPNSGFCKKWTKYVDEVYAEISHPEYHVWNDMFLNLVGKTAIGPYLLLLDRSWML